MNFHKPASALLPVLLACAGTTFAQADAEPALQAVAPRAQRGLPGSAFNFNHQVDGILENGSATGRFEATFSFVGAQGIKRFAHALDKSKPTNVYDHVISGRDFRWSRCQNEGILTVTLRASVDDPEDEGIVDVLALDAHSLAYPPATQCTAR